MLWLSHTHAASASLAAVRLDHWLADGPCLCVAQHSSLSIVSLTSVHGAPGEAAVYPPLSCVLRMPLNARILTIQAVPALADGGAHRTDRIAVLTDHPVPRLLVLRPATAEEVAQQENKSSPWSRIITEAALDLAETSRPAAELGLGLAIEKTVATSPPLASVWTVSHVYRGQLQVMPLSQTGGAQDKRVSDVGAAFLVRLPHPVLIGMTFLERQEDAPASVLALLSLSSKPSKIPGFGEQCLPVLSFHRLDGASQQLESVPWGAPRRAPVHTDPSSSDSGSASTGRGSGPGKRGKRQPSAVGRRLDAKERNAREQEWADDPLTRAHVPLPHDDALGAHLLCGVPAAAGGGVIVFCEHCVLYVPPPRASALRSGKPVPDSSFQAKRHGPESAQRQKRRKLHPEDDELEQGSVSVDETMPQLLRIGVKKPMCVVASTVVHDYAPRDQANASPCVPIVFGTSDGRLYVLVLYGNASGQNESWSPRGLRIACIGSTSTAAGPNGLTYLGEGFVHICSALSDSVLLYAPALVDGEVDALAAPQSSPVPGGSTADVSQLINVRRWTNIGPIVDFVVDRGDSDELDASGIYERTITCSGAGPQCSLRVVRSGVSADEIGGVPLPECLQVFAVDKWADNATANTALIILCYSAHAQILAPGADGFQDVSETFAGAGLNLDTRALQVKSVRAWRGSSLEDYGFVYATAQKVYAVSRSTSGDLRVHTWEPPGKEPDREILFCDVDSDGKVLVGLQSGRLASLAFCSEGARDERIAELPTAVATASLFCVTDELAVVGTWEPHGLLLVRLQDLAPIASLEIALVALDAPITSVLAISFDPQSSDMHVIAGLDSGDVVVFRVQKGKSTLALQKVKSIHLGHQPVNLTSFPTGSLSAVPGETGVLALGVRSLVIYMVGDQLCFSELRYSHVRSATPLQVALQAKQSSEPVLALVVLDQVIFTSVHSLQQLDIRTVPLGANQPTAIQRLPLAHALAVNTWQAQAHERGEEEVFGHVHLFSDQSLQELHSHQLQRNERPNCLTSLTYGDDEHLVVGTGFNDPKRLETTSGRILGFRVQSENGAQKPGSLSVAFAMDVPGNVYALTSMAGHLVAAVDAQVIVYAVQRGKETGELGISVCSRWGCSFIASCLANSAKDRNVLVVGDAMRSLTVLSVNPENGEITELARDLDPYWTTAVETYDDKAQQYLGSDIAMNVFVSKRIPIAASDAIDAPAKDSWSRVMRRDACFHYGDMINKFERANLLEPLSIAPNASQIRFCTAAGSLGALTNLPQSLSEMLDCVQTAMTRVMPSCGNIPMEEWRTVRTDHCVTPAANFLDGDFLKHFVNTCTSAQQERIIAHAKDIATRKYGDRAAFSIGSVSVESVATSIEALP